MAADSWAALQDKACGKAPCLRRRSRDYTAVNAAAVGRPNVVVHDVIEVPPKSLVPPLTERGHHLSVWSVKMLTVALFIALDSSKALFAHWANLGKKDTSVVSLSTQGELILVRGALVDDRLAHGHYVGLLEQDVWLESQELQLRKGWRLMAAESMQHVHGVAALEEMRLPVMLQFSHPSTVIPSTQVIVNDLSSVVIGSAIAGFRSGTSSMMACFHPVECARVLPVAAFFCLAQIFSIQALSLLDAGTFKLLLQAGLPITAVLSTPILQRKYTLVQWECMLLVSLSTVAFFMAKLKTGHVNDMGAQGATYSILCILLSCLGSVIGEFFFKTSPQPFYVIKAHLDIDGSVIAAVTLFAMPLLEVQKAHQLDLGLRGGFFAGWDWRTVVVSAVWVGHSWCSGLIAKQLSSVVKKVSQCIAAFVTFLLSLWLDSGRGFSANTGLLAAMVLISSHLFFINSPPELSGLEEADQPAKSEDGGSPRSPSLERARSPPEEREEVELRHRK